MTLLAPLGLLGLLGVLVLIIIYILRPNYQQKTVSSTYVWRLSLKYRKKRLPTSKLRNILLILCQVLILASCAAILAKPARVLKTKTDTTEVIAILDSSASMQAKSEGETRFERALKEIQTLAQDTYQNDGVVSVILAERSASFLSNGTFLAQRVTAENSAELNDALQSDLKCFNGTSDVDEAFELCEVVLAENPSAAIYLYTDTEYGYVPDGITVENMAEEEEWNVAILDAYTEMDNNYYTFYVDVAYYGSDETRAVTLTLNVVNANSEDLSGGMSVELTRSFSFKGTGEKTIVFITDISYAEMFEGVDMDDSQDGTVYVELGEGKRIYSFEATYVTVDTSDDSLASDNSFNLFNGQKPIIRVQYASASANPFFRGALLTMKSAYANQWDIRITEVKQNAEPATENFDFYLYESKMPEELPTDGVVMLVNPNSAPDGAGFKISQVKELRSSISLTQEKSHKLLNNVNPDNITVSKYTHVMNLDATYETLMSCDGDPVFLVRNETDCKTILMNFSIHYSNLPILSDFPLLMYNIFGYFFPATVSKNAFEVYEEIELNARGTSLSVKKPGEDDLYRFTSFPQTLSLDAPGNYLLVQNNPFKTSEEIKEYIYVKIPSAESDIFATASALEDPYQEENEADYFKDLLLYLASALVALLFVEWWLQSRETA